MYYNKWRLGGFSNFFSVSLPKKVMTGAMFWVKYPGRIKQHSTSRGHFLAFFHKEFLN